MTGSLTLTLPIRAVSESNVRQHWAAKAGRAKSQRLTTWTMLSHAFGVTAPAWCKLPLTITLTRIAPRELDDDNLRGSLKAPRDEITQWLGLKSDRVPGLRWEYAQRSLAPKFYAVEVTITRVDE
jgi:hypothetical protein